MAFYSHRKQETHVFSRTPRSAPHFTTRPRVQPKNTGRLQWGSRTRRGDQAIENARLMGGTFPRLGWLNALIDKGTNVVRAWGSPRWREPPENWVVGMRNE
jgi:hypothetical protein